jgi:hypothetical protein
LSLYRFVDSLLSTFIDSLLHAFIALVGSAGSDRGDAAVTSVGSDRWRRRGEVGRERPEKTRR